MDEMHRHDRNGAQGAAAKKEARRRYWSQHTTLLMIASVIFNLFLTYKLAMLTPHKNTVIEKVSNDLYFFQTMIDSGLYQIDQGLKDMAYRMVYVMLGKENSWADENAYAFMNNSVENDDFFFPPKILNDEVKELIKEINCTHAEKALTGRHTPVRMPNLYTTIPHVLQDQESLVPRYLMKSPRMHSEYVVGIPTVQRHKAIYLHATLVDAVRGITPETYETTLIIVYIGEVDLKYIMETAKMIETLFPRQIRDGLIEIIAPSPSYYPDFEDIKLPSAIGDSAQRAQWRTKQNLDVAYLMTYAETRGDYFLLLEDDVLATKGFIKFISDFVEEKTIENQDWIMIEYSSDGAIGKLFKSRQLPNFVSYVLMLHQDIPMDWIMESYVANKVCRRDRSLDECNAAKKRARPQFISNPKLFHHVGFHSSLKGKIQKVDDERFADKAEFVPYYLNPPAIRFLINFRFERDHSLKDLYEGKSYFLGSGGRTNDVLEVVFERPVWINKYRVRTGNNIHPDYTIRKAAVEILQRHDTDFRWIGQFDEFGIVDGSLERYEHLDSFRMRLLEDSKNPILISEMSFELMANKTEILELVRVFKHPIVKVVTQLPHKG